MKIGTTRYDAAIDQLDYTITAVGESRVVHDDQERCSEHPIVGP